LATRFKAREGREGDEMMGQLGWWDGGMVVEELE